MTEIEKINNDLGFAIEESLRELNATFSQVVVKIERYGLFKKTKIRVRLNDEELQIRQKKIEDGLKKTNIVKQSATIAPTNDVAVSTVSVKPSLVSNFANLNKNVQRLTNASLNSDDNLTKSAVVKPVANLQRQSNAINPAVQKDNSQLAKRLEDKSKRCKDKIKQAVVDKGVPSDVLDPHKQSNVVQSTDNNNFNSQSQLMLSKEFLPKKTDKFNFKKKNRQIEKENRVVFDKHFLPSEEQQQKVISNFLPSKESMVLVANSPFAEYLQNILNLMAITNCETVCHQLHGTLYVEILSDDPLIVANRGELLDALEVVAINYRNSADTKYSKVVLDCQGYRLKRLQSLMRYVFKSADKVVQIGKRIKLDAMSDVNRKFVHTLLQYDERVFAKSEGTSNNRCVVVIPKGSKKDF